MRKIHRLDLDFAKDIRTQRKITFKEQDAITLYASIYNDSVPVVLDGLTPRLFVKKSDGTILYQTEVLSVTNNVVAFDVNIQATTCPGLCYAEIELIEEKEDGKDELITTRSFVYIVEPKVGDVENAIKSENQAYFLKQIEDFIKQAQIDIAEYKETVANLLANVDEANDRLEQFHRDLDEADKSLKDEAQDIVDNLTDLANDTITNIDKMSGNCINLINDTKDNSIERIESAKDLSLQRIEDETTLGKIELNNRTQEHLREIEVKADAEIEECNQAISNLKATIKNGMIVDSEMNKTILNATDTKAVLDDSIAEGKETITEIEDAVIKAVEEVSKLEGEVIVKVNSVSEEHLNALKDAKDSHITEMESKKDEFVSAIEAKDSELEETIADASNTIQTIENVIATANTIKNTLDTSKAEATVINNALNKLVETCNAIKVELEAENVRAEANINTLQGLHPQADIRIETLERLIEQAKQYEEVVRAYIAKFEPAQDLTEVNKQLEALTDAINETYSILVGHNHDVLYGASKKQNFFGDNIYLFKTPSVMDKFICPESFGEYKSCIKFSSFVSSNINYYAIYFKEDLNDVDSQVYVSLDGNTLTINRGENQIDYIALTGTNNSVSGSPVSTRTFSLLGTTEVYALDFPLWDANKESIVLQSPKTSGLNDFNTANIPGYYTIDLPLSTFQQMANAPAIIADKDIKGILEVKQTGVDIVQTLTLHSIGQAFTRVIGQSWERIDGRIANENTMTIGVSQEEAVPEALLTMPKNPYFWDTNGGYIIFQSGDDQYYVVYTYNAPLKAYYAGSTSIYIGHSTNRLFGFRYSSGVWKETLSASSGLSLGSVSVSKAYFRILACSHPVYTSSAYDTVYCDKKALNYSVMPTLTNFRDIPKTGKYYVDINVGDDIAYAPYTTTVEWYIAKSAEALEFVSDDDGLLTASELSNVPQFIETGVVNYKTKARAITTRAIKGYVDAVVKDNGEKHLTFYGDDGDVLKMTYNGSEWIDWKSIGGQEIDLSLYPTNEDLEQNYYNKVEIDKAIKEAGVPFCGIIGVSSYPSVFATCPVPEKDIIGEVEAFSVYNQRYVKVYIHPLEDSPIDLSSAKVLSKYNGTYRLSFNSNIVGDFTAYYKTETGDWTLDASANFHCYLNTTDVELMRRNIFKNTFNLTDGSITVEAKTNDDSLIGSYNSATKTGTYKVSHSSKIEGAIKDSCEGVLVVDKADNRIIQTLTENNGKVSTRYYEGVWTKWVGADDIGDISFAIRTEFATKNEYYPMWKFEPARNPEYPYRIVLTMGTKYGRIIDFKQDPTGYLKYDKSTNKLVWGEGYESLEMLHYYTSDIKDTPSYNYSTLKWSTTTSATQYFTSVVLDWYQHNFDILDTEGNVYRKSEEFDTSNVITDFNLATELSKYNVDINIDEEIANKPANIRIKGYMNVEECKNYIRQELITEDVVYKRLYRDFAWTAWETEVKQDEFDSLNNQVQGLALPIPNKINTFEYTNSDGMPEVYKYFDINGFKVMWIDVKMSDAEYNMGSNGLIMKTLNIPAEAQIFNNIIMANITSYCREGENTLSRIVQNAEVISNVSVRGRWRHTDNTYPKIDRFTIMCFGF